MKAGQNTQLGHLSVYTHQQWPTLCMSTFASPIVWVRMSKRDCIVYLLNMHVSLSALSGCSIEGRTPSTSASVCGGSACMKPRAHMGRWQCGFYHARAYCSIPLWCTALRCLWTFLMKASGNSQSCLGTARIRDGQRGNLGLQKTCFLRTCCFCWNYFVALIWVVAWLLILLVSFHFHDFCTVCPRS